MPGPSNIPNEQLAREVVIRALGAAPTTIRRFTTGNMHYVYEVDFATRPSVVVRIAADYGHAAMRGAARLARFLRPRAVPLPAVVAENLAPPFPHLILERLPGADLGDVMVGLSPLVLEKIAAAVTSAQQITAAAYPRGQRYGYAVAPEDAPHASWPDVLAAHLERSRQRIAAAGIFAPSEIAPLKPILAAMVPELAAIPPTPFLHDTTTKNVIVTSDGQFSGIVDVDDLCFGDPRYVVALTHTSLLAHGFPTLYTKAWMRLAQFADDRPFRLYVALFLADFMAERGQRFNNNPLPADAEYDARLRDHFQRTLGQIRSRET